MIVPAENDVIDRAMESGDPVIAEEAFRKLDSMLELSVHSKEKADLLMRKAVLYEVLGHFGDARRQLGLALKEAPDGPDIRLKFDYIDGALYHQEQNYSEAFARLSRALSRHAEQLTLPQFRFIYEDIQQHRAFELFRLHQFQDAVPVFRECLLFEMKPEDRSSALANLGICYAKLKKYEDAREYLCQASKMGIPREWEGHVHFYLAFTYAHLRCLRESKREFQFCEEHAIEYQFPLDQIYAWLSRICKELGEIAESERYGRLARPV